MAPIPELHVFLIQSLQKFLVEWLNSELQSTTMISNFEFAAFILQTPHSYGLLTWMESQDQHKLLQFGFCSGRNNNYNKQGD